jgi:hypothetical protein
MNNKIRLIFLIVVFIICIGSLVKFNAFQAPLSPKIDRISEFKITKISGNGKIYFDKNPIASDEGSPLSAGVVNIKQMQYPGPMYFKADEFTAFEFYCVGISFTVLPRSYFYYQPGSSEIYFYSGEFYWDKKVAGNKDEISVYIRKAQNILTLSDAGRINIQEDLIRIWNYSSPDSTSESGNLTFKDGENEQMFNLKPVQLLILKEDTPPKMFAILPLPESIEPEKKVIELNNPDDSIVRFNWKSVAGATQYVFRLYSSNLRENILVEKTTPLSWVNLDLVQFEEREFYWQVVPINIDEGNQVEGVPSQLGHVQMVGALLGKKDVQKPPEMTIKSLTVNGNLVIIKGTADANSQLQINDDQVKVDMDGEFIHYLSFKTIGPKRILFRLLSPLGIETTEERYVTIFAE